MHIEEECVEGPWIDEELAWDCLTDRQRECLEMSLIKQMNHDDIAYVLEISQQAVSKHISAATERITEFSKARKILKSQVNPSQRAIKYYRMGMNQSEIAAQEGISQKSVSDYLSKWKKDHNI